LELWAVALHNLLLLLRPLNRLRQHHVVTFV
jgi:hypothetical protein